MKVRFMVATSQKSQISLTKYIQIPDSSRLQAVLSTHCIIDNDSSHCSFSKKKKNHRREDSDLKLFHSASNKNQTMLLKN